MDSPVVQCPNASNISSSPPRLCQHRNLKKTMYLLFLLGCNLLIISYGGFRLFGCCAFCLFLILEFEVFILFLKLFGMLRLVVLRLIFNDEIGTRFGLLKRWGEDLTSRGGPEFRSLMACDWDLVKIVRLKDLTILLKMN